jgi:hypothetical protein
LSHKYDIPRWHQDASYFSRNNIITSKFVTTLLIKSTKRISNIFNSILNDSLEEMKKTNNQENKIKIYHKYRPIYSYKFKNEKIIKVKNNK